MAERIVFDLMTAKWQAWDGHTHLGEDSNLTTLTERFPDAVIDWKAVNRTVTAWERMTDNYFGRED